MYKMDEHKCEDCNRFADVLLWDIYLCISHAAQRYTLAMNMNDKKHLEEKARIVREYKDALMRGMDAE